MHQHRKEIEGSESSLSDNDYVIVKRISGFLPRCCIEKDDLKDTLDYLADGFTKMSNDSIKLFGSSLPASGGILQGLELGSDTAHRLLRMEYEGQKRIFSFISAYVCEMVSSLLCDVPRVRTTGIDQTTYRVVRKFVKVQTSRLFQEKNGLNLG
jgi:hypothetical protein